MIIGEKKVHSMFILSPATARADYERYDPVVDALYGFLILSTISSSKNAFLS